MSGRTQFEGRTAEEAVARARKALGDSNALRCWKTRKGGVGGFFAREVYVASLTPPPGSEETGVKGSRTTSRKPSDGRAGRTVSDGSARSRNADAPPPSRAGESSDPEDHLSGLVEATNDQLSLQSLAIPAGAFDQVLAEAQAALARLPEVGDAERTDHFGVRPEDEGSDADVEHRRSAAPAGEGEPPDREEAALPGTAGAVARTNAEVKRAARPKPKARPKPRPARSAPTPTPAPRNRVSRLPDLKPGLRRLGTPNSYLPQGRCPSLDQLADAMATLPVPAELPTDEGAVVGVVGTGDDLARTLDLVTSRLSLVRNDVLTVGRRAGIGTEGPGGSVRGALRLDGQIARRRASGRQSVLAVDATPGRLLEQEARACLERLVPDYVLLGVNARSKRADVEHWITQLPNVDALALWDLASTRTPAELLGVQPIAFVDGEAGTPLGWTLVLAGRVVGWHR